MNPGIPVSPLTPAHHPLRPMVKERHERKRSRSSKVSISATPANKGQAEGYRFLAMITRFLSER